MTWGNPNDRTNDASFTMSAGVVTPLAITPHEPSNDDKEQAVAACRQESSWCAGVFERDGKFERYERVGIQC